MTNKFLGSNLQRGRVRGQENRAFLRGLDESVGTGTIFGQSVGLGLEAPGSTRDDVTASIVARERNKTDELGFFTKKVGQFAGVGEERQGREITKEEFEKSRFFREDVDFQEGMTDIAAARLAEDSDRRLRRQLLLSASDSVLDNIATVGGALVGGVVDPKNLTAGVAAAAVTGGTGILATGAGAAVRNTPRAGRAMQALKQLEASARRGGQALNRGRVAQTATEATLATLPSIASGLSNTEFTGQEYDTSDAALDFAASLVLDVGLNVGISGIKRAAGLRRAQKVYNDRVPFEQRTQLAEIAQAQIEAGQQIDVAPVAAAQLSDHLPEFSTVRIDSETPTIRQVSEGEFEATFQNETGLMEGVTGRGSTPDEAISSLTQRYDRPGDFAEELGLPPSVLERLKEASDATPPLSGVDDLSLAELSEFRRLAESRGAPVDKLDAALNKRRDTQGRLNEAEFEARSNPGDEDAKKELRNARQAARRARERIDEILRADFAPLLRETRLQRAKERGQSLTLRRAASAGLKGNEKVAFENFLRRQTLNPDDPEARPLSRDPDIRNYDPKDVRARAKEAPQPGEQFGANARAAASEGRQAMEARLESDLVPEDQKADLREALGIIDEQKQRVDVLAKLKPCLTGGRLG